MTDDIIIHGIGSFDRKFVQSMGKGAWAIYLKEIHPAFEQAEQVWAEANKDVKKANVKILKKENETIKESTKNEADVPISDDQL